MISLVLFLFHLFPSHLLSLSRHTPSLALNVCPSVCFSLSPSHSLYHTHIHTHTRVQRLHEAHVPFTRPLILSRSLTRPFSPSLVYSRCFTLTLTRPPQAARSMEHAMKERKKKQEREKRVSEWKERPVSARHEARNLHDRQHEESVRVSDQGTR